MFKKKSTNATKVFRKNDCRVQKVKNNRLVKIETTTRLGFNPADSTASSYVHVIGFRFRNRLFSNDDTSAVCSRNNE